MSIDQYSSTPASNDLTNYFRTGMRPSAVKTAGWDIMADLASYIVGLPTASGTANAITVSNGRPFGSLVAGLLQVLSPAAANTGPATFAPDGLTAKNIYVNGAPLAGGEIQPNAPAILKYDNTQWNLLNPAAPGKNFFVDPCCRVAQGDGTTNLSTTYGYGLVDLVQCKAGGSVSAGKITQDTAATVAAGATAYSCKLQNCTITGTGKVFFRRWIESRDAIALKNKTVLFSVLCRHDVGSSVNAFLTINKFNAQDTTGSGVTAIATGSTVSIATATDTGVTAAVSLGDCSNGIEIILEMDCGAVTTRSFYATDWQACILTLPQKCVVPRFVDDRFASGRYFESSYPYGTAPATASSGGIGFRAAEAIGTGTAYGQTVIFKTPKLVSPVVTFYSTSTGSSGVVNDSSTGTDKSVTTFAKTTESTELVNNSGATIAAGDIIRYHYVADGRL